LRGLQLRIGRHAGGLWLVRIAIHGLDVRCALRPNRIALSAQASLARCRTHPSLRSSNPLLDVEHTHVGGAQRPLRQHKSPPFPHGEG
jgi:hypothetical protein